jgi:superkiller protein 3
MNLGDALCKLKKWDEAVAVYREAIDLGPKDSGAYLGLGNALRGQKKLDDAVAAYRRGIDLDPKESGAWINLGNALLDQNKLDDALAAYRRALELNQEYSIAAAYNNIAEVLWKQNKLEEATSVYREYERRAREAFRQNPDDARTREALALWLNNWAWVLATDPDAKKRDPGRAVSLAQEAAELTPKDSARWRTLGVAHYRTGDWVAARAALDKSLELGFLRGSNRFFLAMAHWQLGEKDKAREWYDRAVEWMDKNQPNLSAEAAEELRRFRAEAAELLELDEKK